MNTRCNKPAVKSWLAACLILTVVGTAALTGLMTCHPLPPIRYDFDPPPVEWVPMRSEKGTLLFERQDPLMGIMVNTECERYQNVPLNPLSRTLFIGFEDRREIHRAEALVDGHEAVEVVMECSLEDVPLKVKAYVFKAGGCIYDVVYFASPDQFDNGADTFEEFVDGFHVPNE